MQNFSEQHRERLQQLLLALIDQESASVLVPPYQASSGFWFGGGNLVQDDEGTLWLSGRYRNYGDSRTGLEAGQRGMECALFRSVDGGRHFEKAASWSKADLSFADGRTLSIEGTALHRLLDGSWELFISSEKERSYPAGLESYQKPGTGVWTIDRITGPSLDALDPATLSPVLENESRPEYLHVKDPVVFDLPDGQTALIFCTHPFSWTSSNSGLAQRFARQDSFAVESWEVASRGAGWDVAATRITARMVVPPLGIFADMPSVAVYFYDGAECLRQLDENERAHSRPRGYSCEELGGALVGWNEAFPQMTRLSTLFPLFVSPHGTGCSRYVDVLSTDGGLFATWQQGQADGSQPLVGNFLSTEQIAQILE